MYLSQNIKISFILFSAILTIIYPNIDIAISNIFFNNLSNEFIYKDNIIVNIIYKSVPLINYITLGLCILSIIFSYIKHDVLLRKKAIYIILSISISTGIVANYAFKDHFGRARPYYIKEFGGDKEFSPAFTISDQCRKNCSFISGHSSTGFGLSALAFAPVSKPIFLPISIILGIIIGIARILQGGHFASDILFAGIIVIGTNYIISRVYNRFSSGFITSDNNN